MSKNGLDLNKNDINVKEITLEEFKWLKEKGLVTYIESTYIKKSTKEEIDNLEDNIGIVGYIKSTFVVVTQE